MSFFFSSGFMDIPYDFMSFFPRDAKYVRPCARELFLLAYQPLLSSYGALSSPSKLFSYGKVSLFP